MVESAGPSPAGCQAVGGFMSSSAKGLEYSWRLVLEQQAVKQSSCQAVKLSNCQAVKLSSCLQEFVFVV